MCNEMNDHRKVERRDIQKYINAKADSVRTGHGQPHNWRQLKSFERTSHTLITIFTWCFVICCACESIERETNGMNLCQDIRCIPDDGSSTSIAVNTSCTGDVSTHTILTTTGSLAPNIALQIHPMLHFRIAF